MVPFTILDDFKNRRPLSRSENVRGFKVVFFFLITVAVASMLFIYLAFGRS
jgi:hypothetical protein